MFPCCLDSEMRILWPETPWGARIAEGDTS